MKKKLLLLLLLVSMLMCALAFAVSAETPSMYIDFKVKLEGSTDYITVYAPNDESSGNPRLNFNKDFYSDIEFTSTVDKSKIIGIDFSESQSHGSSTKYITRMTKPDKPITSCQELFWFTTDGAMNNSIPSNVFSNWTKLKTIDFGCATSINDNAFQNTGIEELVIPATITSVANSTFRACANLRSVKFEGGTSKIGLSMFSECTMLSSVDLGSITLLGTSMFDKCTSLTSIVIPSTVKTINSQAFLSCPNLSSVSLHDGITEIGTRAFEGTGITSIVIPKALTAISDKAFYSCTKLTSVTFAEGINLLTIGKEAFHSVPASNLTVPSTVTKIGSSAFYNSGITSVTISASVTIVGSSCFTSCKSLKTVVFENGFTGTIESSAFSNTSALESLTLCEGITEIPYQCFYQTGVASIRLPDSVTTLAARAFSESLSIKELIISENSQLKSITSSFNSTSITSIYLPTGVKILESPFSQCQKLEYIYNFENTVFVNSNGEETHAIPKNCFNECRALKEIRLPNGITSIGESAFNRCGGEGLVFICIPASVTSIHKNAFPKATDWQAPKNAIIYYCGGSAQKLLSLSNDGSGNVSAYLSDRVNNGKVTAYTGMNTSYESGVIVENVFTCDLYFGGIHAESDEIAYIYVDKDGNVTQDKFTSTIKVTCPCGRKCGAETVLETLSPLFNCLGFSLEEGSRGGVVIGFQFNYSSLVRYEELTGTELTFGVFAASQKNLGSGSIFDDNGEAATGVVSAKISNIDFAVFQLKIYGFTNDEQKNAKLALGAYVAESSEGSTEYSYIQPLDPKQGENYSFLSYNEMVAYVE